MLGPASGRFATALPWVLTTFLCATDLLAQRIPVRCYDVTDGLAQNWVRVVAQDRKGFLWIGTAEGVSRFNGYNFVNYGLADGLDSVFINDIVEDRGGRSRPTAAGSHCSTTSGLTTLAQVRSRTLRALRRRGRNSSASA